MSKEKRYEIRVCSRNNNTKSKYIYDRKEDDAISFDKQTIIDLLNNQDQQIAELKAEVERLKMSGAFEKEKKENALTLVEKFKAENERLKEECKDKYSELHGSFVSNDKLSAKISELKKRNKELLELNEMSVNYLPLIDNLQQQLKEKDEKLAKYSRYEKFRFEAPYGNVIIIGETFEDIGNLLNKYYALGFKYATKQFCEKIRGLCKDCWEVKEYKSSTGTTLQGVFNEKKFLQEVEKIEKGENK